MIQIAIKHNLDEILPLLGQILRFNAIKKNVLEEKK